VLCAKGKSLEEIYLAPRDRLDSWYFLDFPTEYPPGRDFALWNKALFQVAPRGRLQDRLGEFEQKRHKVWEWRYRPQDDMLFRVQNKTVLVLPRSMLTRHQNTLNRYTHQEVMTTEVDEDLGEVATVRYIAPAVWSISGHAPQAILPPAPTDFREILLEWEHTWLWANFRLAGDVDWIEEVIRDQSLIAVTDGSYMKEAFPTLSSVAYNLECKHGRGRPVGSFPEQSVSACAYRGELVGLLAIHLILLSGNKVNPSLTGRVNYLLRLPGRFRSGKRSTTF